MISELQSHTFKSDDFTDCDLVVEAGLEEIGIKREIFSELSVPLRLPTIFTINTSFADSQSMTGESIVFGTCPTRPNSFAESNIRDIFVELKDEFNLIFNFDGVVSALAKVCELFPMCFLGGVRYSQSVVMPKEKIAMTTFPAWLIESDPDWVTETETDTNHQSVIFSRKQWSIMTVEKIIILLFSFLPDVFLKFVCWCLGLRDRVQLATEKRTW